MNSHVSVDIQSACNIWRKFMVVGPSRHTHMCNAVTLVCGSLRLPHITAYCIVPGKLPWSLTAQTEGVRLYRGGALMVQLSPHPGCESLLHQCFIEASPTVHGESCIMDWSIVLLASFHNVHRLQCANLYCKRRIGYGQVCIELWSRMLWVKASKSCSCSVCRTDWSRSTKHTCVHSFLITCSVSSDSLKL